MIRFLIATGMALLASIALAGVVEAQSHPQAPRVDPYIGYTDPVTGEDCCHGVHCRPIPIPDEDIRPTSVGFYVRTATDESGWLLIPFARVIWSDPDGTARFHRCEDSTHVRCLIAPPARGA